MTGELIHNPEHEQEITRKLASTVLVRFESLQELILKQHADAFKWLMASLLAINGGAALSILQFDKIALNYKLLSCSSLALGVIFALLIAVLSQKIAQLSMKPVAELVGYWMSVTVDGVRGEDLETELNTALQRQAKFSWIVPASGWLSAIFFLAGVILAGAGQLEFEMKKMPNLPGSQNLTK